MVHTHKERIVDMLIHSFSENKRIQGIVRKSSRSHLSALFNYVYENIKSRGHFYFSENKSTVVLYYRASTKSINIKTMIAVFRLLICSSSARILRSSMTNRIVKNTRKSHAQSNGFQDYFYIWFLARTKGVGDYKGLLDLITHLKTTSANNKIPLYLETTSLRMKKIYERAGFHFYENIQVGNLRIYFANMINYC